MNRIQRIVATALGLAIVLGGAFPTRLLADRESEAPPPSGSAVAERLAAEVVARLELSPSRRSVLTALLAEHHEELLDELIVLDEAHSALRRWTLTETPEVEGIRRASQLVASAELELTLHTAELIREIRTALTPQQRFEAPDLADGFRSAVAGEGRRSRRLLPAGAGWVCLLCQAPELE